MKLVNLITCLAVLSLVSPAAQEEKKSEVAPALPAPAADASTPPAAKPDAEKTDPEDPVELNAPKGDVITLKNGKKIQGIQVVRSTPKEYQCEAANGAVAFSILRSQVDSIVYDDIDPSRMKGVDPNTAARWAESIISGQKLAPELDKKLAYDLTNPPMQYKQTNLLKVLEDLAGRSGVSIVVDPSVSSLPPEDLLWDLESKPGMTLLTFLRDDLPARFPNLAVQYQYDKIVVTTKDAAAKKPSEAPAAPGN